VNYLKNEVILMQFSFLKMIYLDFVVFYTAPL